MLDDDRWRLANLLSLERERSPDRCPITGELAPELYGEFKLEEEPYKLEDEPYRLEEEPYGESATELIEL